MCTVKFRPDVVQRVKDGLVVAVVARELSTSERTLRNWVKDEVSCKLNGAGADGAVLSAGGEQAPAGGA